MQLKYIKKFFFENIPNIESKMNKNEKFAKMLKKVLYEIITNKIYKKSSTKKKLLILHGLMIQNYLISRYHKDKNSTELLSIQNFLDDINNDDIKNKKDAYKKFKDLKNNIKSGELKDIAKELERAIFGYDYENEELSDSGLKYIN